MKRDMVREMISFDQGQAKGWLEDRDREQHSTALKERLGFVEISPFNCNMS